MQFKRFIHRQEKESQTDEREKPGNIQPGFLRPEPGKKQDQTDRKQLDGREPGRNCPLGVQIKEDVNRTGHAHKHVEKIDQNQTGFKKQQGREKGSRVLFGIRQMSFYGRIRSLKKTLLSVFPCPPPEEENP